MSENRGGVDNDKAKLMTRRKFLRASIVGAGGALLAACAPSTTSETSKTSEALTPAQEMDAIIAETEKRLPDIGGNIELSADQRAAFSRDFIDPQTAIQLPQITGEMSIVERNKTVEEWIKGTANRINYLPSPINILGSDLTGGMIQVVVDSFSNPQNELVRAHQFSSSMMGAYDYLYANGVGWMAINSDPYVAGTPGGFTSALEAIQWPEHEDGHAIYAANLGSVFDEMASDGRIQYNRDDPKDRERFFESAKLRQRDREAYAYWIQAGFVAACFAATGENVYRPWGVTGEKLNDTFGQKIMGIVELRREILIDSNSDSSSPRWKDPRWAEAVKGTHES